MILDKISDPRTTINMLSRKELEYLARKENRSDISPDMPADLMKARFTNNPPSRMPRPMRPMLGAYKRFVIPPYDEWCRVAFGDVQQPKTQTVHTSSALEDLERQYSEQTAPRATKVSIQDLRKACKARGIKLARTDNRDILMEKLNGQNPS